MIKALAPATAGEFIQGIYQGVPVLVSAPINLFSQTIIKEGSGINNLKPKGLKVLELLKDGFGLTESHLNRIDIIQTSKIPESKGMASSTADLVSLLGSLNYYYKLGLSEPDLAKICCQVEPSDNIMFKKINLFNHYTGEIFRESNKIDARVLLIEFKNTVDTVSFGYETEFKKSEEEFKKIVDKFFEGIENKDLNLLAQATSESAFLNQTALFNPYLETVYDLALKYNSPGVCIGHSGSVIGIIYINNISVQKLSYEILDKFDKNIVSIKPYKFVPGGVRIQYF